MNPDSRIRDTLEEHWQASECGDIEADQAIYATDAILDYPQSGERFRGRATISAQRGGHPADRHFTVLRIVGSGNLWVSECVITYDGVPTYSVSIMEFADEHVVHETQYFADTFGAPAWRTALAEPMPGRNHRQRRLPPMGREALRGPRAGRAGAAQGLAGLLVDVGHEIVPREEAQSAVARPQ